MFVIEMSRSNRLDILYLIAGAEVTLDELRNTEIDKEVVESNILELIKDATDTIESLINALERVI